MRGGGGKKEKGADIGEGGTGRGEGGPEREKGIKTNIFNIQSFHNRL